MGESPPACLSPHSPTQLKRPCVCGSEFLLLTWNLKINHLGYSVVLQMMENNLYCIQGWFMVHLHTCSQRQKTFSVYVFLEWFKKVHFGKRYHMRNTWWYIKIRIYKNPACWQSVIWFKKKKKGNILEDKLVLHGCLTQGNLEWQPGMFTNVNMKTIKQIMPIDLFSLLVTSSDSLGWDPSSHPGRPLRSVTTSSAIMTISAE